MKKIVVVILSVSVSMLFSAIAVIGAQNYPVPFGTERKSMQPIHKNECLLVAKNCATESSTVQQRLIDLRNEISKGLKVYSPTELNMLKEQLKWIESDSRNAVI